MTRIPHKDPDPPTSLPVGYRKEDGLTLEDFHAQPKDVKGIKPLQQDDEHSKPHWKHVADKINDLRNRFAQHNPKGGSPRCCNLDRSAVLAVYQEALSILEHTSEVDSRKIHLEVVSKVTTILDLRTAEPNDPVFTMKDAFLSPLEPHYAQPRLNYHDREATMNEDSYYYAGLVRLREWRKEGWPNVYPAKAVEQERKERARKRREGKTVLRPTAAEGLLSAYYMDERDWGEEVNADPERPWK